MTRVRTSPSFATAIVLFLSACASPVTSGHGDAASDARTDGSSTGDAARDTGPHDAVTTDTIGGEVCSNGLDDDQNGLVDDNCPCLPGQMQACFIGEPALGGNGVCHMGQQRCTGQGELGMWEACMGSGHPSTETCDGMDNDCDGNVDNGLGSTTCGMGLCQVTVLNCLNGMMQTCTPGAGSPETCDGMDNDCNGMVDDGLGTTTCGSGSCIRMVMNCVGGMTRTCDPTGPSPEVCDGIDNDCNGMIDDGLPPLTCGSGPCTNTVPSCVGGMAATCTPLPGSPEVCDNIDNDCNGLVDDGLGSTTCGSGTCVRTVPNCVGGVMQTCSSPTSSPEVCDGIDNDCNGMIDDGIPSTSCSVPGEPCRIGSTMCSSGTTTCVATGVVPSGTACPPVGVCDGAGVCHPPVNCMGSWSGCSAPCGGGTMTYTVTQPAQYGGAACPYSSGDMLSCNEGMCPPRCTTVEYPYIEWTCPADGHQSQIIAPWGCGCESYDATGMGVNCSLSYGYSVPNCVPGPISEFVDHSGACYCHL